jgi:hypothetical protein
MDSSAKSEEDSGLQAREVAATLFESVHGRCGLLSHVDSHAVANRLSSSSLLLSLPVTLCFQQRSVN